MNKIALIFPQGEISEDYTWTNSGNPSVQQTFSNWFLAGINPAQLTDLLFPFIIVIAGLILFGVIIAGGFNIFLSSGNPDKIKKGQGMVTISIVGFIVIFAAYWISQFLSYSLGVSLLQP